MPFGDLGDISKRKIVWHSDTDFAKGTLDSEVEVNGSGDDAVLRLKSKTDSDNNILYTTPSNYTLSDGSKLEIDGGNAQLKAASGSTNDWPFTTAGNYTYDNGKVVIAGGDAQLKYFNEKCINLDGTDEYVNCGNDASLDITNNLSCFAWVNTNSASTGTLAGRYDTGSNLRSWYMALDNSGNFFVVLSKDGTYNVGSRKFYQSTGTYNDNSWHLVGFTFANDTLKMYVDGNEISPTKTYDDTVNSVYDTSTDFLIGASRSSGSPNNLYEGLLDEVSLWDDVLSGAEITELYNSGNPKDLSAHSASADLVSWWRCGDGDTHPTLTDNQGSNDGTMTNTESGDITTATDLETYFTDTPNIVPNTGFVFTASLNTFTESVTKPANTGIKYHVSSDDGSTWKYWNGSAWAVTDDSYTQANVANDIQTNISTLAGSGTFKFRALLSSDDGVSTPELDNIHVAAASSYPTDDNLYIDTKDAVQIAPSDLTEWLTTTITNSKPTNTDIRILFSNDGRNSWLTWGGSSWEAPTSATTRTDATSITDAQTNFSDLPVGSGTLDARLFLYTSDSTVRPAVSNINATGDSGYETSGNWESNQYNSTYRGLNWGKVEWTETTPSGTNVVYKIRAANSIAELNLENYTTISASGDDSGVIGQYVQFKAELFGTASERPEIDELIANFIISTTQQVSP